MIQLYDHPLSPYAQKVKIAMHEKGVEFATAQPDSLGSGATGGDFAAISPRGEVPALVHDDVRIFDSTVIVDYIDEAWPNPPLLPDDPAARARVRLLEDVMDTHYEAITWGLSEVRNFGRAEGGEAEALEAAAAEQLGGWHRWLEAQLGGAAWFGGAEFGRGDLAVIPFVNGATGFGLGPSDDTALASWQARANQRPSVAACVADIAALAASQEMAPSLEQVRAAIDAGLFKREYRDHRLEWMIKSGGIEVVRSGLDKGNIRFTETF